MSSIKNIIETHIEKFYYIIYETFIYVSWKFREWYLITTYLNSNEDDDITAEKQCWCVVYIWPMLNRVVFNHC